MNDERFGLKVEILVWLPESLLCCRCKQADSRNSCRCGCFARNQALVAGASKPRGKVRLAASLLGLWCLWRQQF